MAKKDLGGIPTPNVIDPPESMQVTLCVPKNADHLSAFFGALWELTMWNSWQPDAAHTGTELAAVWYRYWLSWNRTMSDIDCEDGNMNCCTEPAIIRRVNPATGNEEQSIDGGVTWKPAPGGWKPLITIPAPPVTSGVAATKCDAATNVAGQVDAWIDKVSNNFDTAVTLIEFGIGVIVAVAGAVLVVLTGGGLLPAELALIGALSAGIYAAWGAGKSVFDAYWTTDIKDKILCAAYCTIGDDGSFSEAQFSEFWNKVNTGIPGSPAKILFMGFLSSVGAPGLCAMAATGMAADADCSDCDCDACGVTAYAVEGESILIGRPEPCKIDLQSVNDGGSAAAVIYMWFKEGGSFDANACGVVTAIEILTGSGVVTGYNDCVTGVLHNPDTPINKCISQLYMYSAAPFSVRVTYEGCP